MPDVMVKFLRPLPITAQLNAEWWTINLGSANKSGKQLVLTATCGGVNFRQVKLWSNHYGMLQKMQVDGFLVKSGTPARGLVTALRRAGLVDLKPVRPR